MSKKGISRRTLFGSTALMAGANLLIPSAAAQVVPNSCAPLPTKWDFEADVVVIGAGACGMAAAIRAADFGADVLVVDTNYDVGGHAILSAGSIALGGGTALQKKYGIQDDPETYFQDLTDWSVTEVDGMPDYRFADRAVQHALAYNGPAVYDFLAANGLPFEDEAPDNFQANHASGVTAPPLCGRSMSQHASGRTSAFSLTITWIGSSANSRLKVGSSVSKRITPQPFCQARQNLL